MATKQRQPARDATPADHEGATLHEYAVTIDMVEVDADHGAKIRRAATIESATPDKAASTAIAELAESLRRAGTEPRPGTRYEVDICETTTGEHWRQSIEHGQAPNGESEPAPRSEKCGRTTGTRARRGGEQRRRRVHGAGRIGHTPDDHEPRWYYVKIAGQKNPGGDRVPLSVESCVLAWTAARAAELAVTEMQIALPGLPRDEEADTVYDVDVVHMDDDEDSKEAWRIEVVSEARDRLPQRDDPAYRFH